MSDYNHGNYQAAKAALRMGIYSCFVVVVVVVVAIANQWICCIINERNHLEYLKSFVSFLLRFVLSVLRNCQS